MDIGDEDNALYFTPGGNERTLPSFGDYGDDLKYLWIGTPLSLTTRVLSTPPWIPYLMVTYLPVIQTMVPSSSPGTLGPAATALTYIPVLGMEVYVFADAATVSAVPLPAPFALLAGAIAALGLFGAARRRSA